VPVPVEVIEAGEVGMVVGEPVAQHPNGLDPTGPGHRPQRGRDVTGVADDISAYVRLGDVAGMLDLRP